MGRPALDPAYKAARLAKARREAEKLNKNTPRYVHAFANPHGRVYVRYEPPGGRKVLLKNPFPSIEFDEELLAARKGLSAPTRRSRQAAIALVSPQYGTLRWLCETYFGSTIFRGYTARDQRVRRGVLLRICDAPLLADQPFGDRFGDMPLAKFQTKAVFTLRDRFARGALVPDPMFPHDRSKDRQRPTTPEAGNSAVKYVRGVLDWAVQEHTALVGGRNWAREVKYLSPGRGHRTWGPEQCAAFERKHMPGSQMRLIYDIARLTGQRLSDVARLSMSMIERKDGGRDCLKFVQAKGRNKEPVTAYVPIFPQLRTALDAARATGVLGSDTFVSKPGGGSYTAESLANLFRDGCKAAGLTGYSMHGLRKTAVVNLIRADCSFFEIMAITGHRSKKEIERYGREFMREAATDAVIDKWLARHRDDPDLDEVMA